MKNYYQSQIADTVPQVFSEAEFRRLYNYDKDTKILLTFVHDEEVSFYELAWLVKDIDGAYFCSVFPDFDLPEGKLTYRPAEENNIISRNSNFYNIRKDNIQGIYIEKICFISNIVEALALSRYTYDIMFRSAFPIEVFSAYDKKHLYYAWMMLGTLEEKQALMFFQTPPTINAYTKKSWRSLKEKETFIYDNEIYEVQKENNRLTICKICSTTSSINSFGKVIKNKLNA